MESLATLNRDQLLKLLHYAINEDPGGVLGKVFSRIGMIIVTLLRPDVCF